MLLVPIGLAMKLTTAVAPVAPNKRSFVGTTGLGVTFVVEVSGHTSLAWVNLVCF
jgi:hypothetical protein